MSQSNHPRRVGRETVLQAMYAYEILNEDKDKILKDILSRHSFDNKMELFITDLFSSAINNKKWCEEKIIERLNDAKNIISLDTFGNPNLFSFTFILVSIEGIG